ncbi:MAG: polysaccharide deacetylase family protein [Bacteroidia bacterium]|jgi:hypothetical protein|nr:polysaccharide deacetylase family protein [Bacteroidia bacterium]
MRIKIRWIICILLILALSTCKKDDQHQILGPGIFLSTDLPAHTWFDLREYLLSRNAKITFYTQSYQFLDSASKAKIKIMMQDGHEMAHHTSHHIHADEYMRSHSISDYMHNEIYNMDSALEADGIFTENFAYPYGDFTQETDRALLQRFKSIRKIISPYANKKLADVDQIYYRFKGVRILYGCTVDSKMNFNVKEILEALDKAKSSRQTISLYCHFVNRGQAELNNQLAINYNDFIAIIEHANKLRLKFYTAKEISR